MQSRQCKERRIRVRLKQRSFSLRQRFPFPRSMSNAASSRGSRCWPPRSKRRAVYVGWRWRRRRRLRLEHGDEVLTNSQYEVAPLSEVAIKKNGHDHSGQRVFLRYGVGIPVVRLKEIITKTPSVFLSNPERYSNVWLEPNDIVSHGKTSFSYWLYVHVARP